MFGAESLRGGRVAPSYRSSSVGAKPSGFTPSFGGLCAVGAGEKLSVKRIAGPYDKPTAAAYALALEEQIAARKAMLPVDAEVKSTNLLTEKERQDKLKGEVLQAQESYAAALREQIANRNVQRAESERRSDISLGSAARVEFSQEVATRGKRCGAVALDSKESYAVQLSDQMAARQAQREAELAQQRQTPRERPPLYYDASSVRGRRHISRDLMTKEAYADELREQMVERANMRAQERSRSSQSCGPLGIGEHAASPVAAGRRVAANISQSSKQEYNMALKQQMEEKATCQAANAHHRQLEPPIPRGSDVLEARGGRRLGGPMHLGPKSDYALELQQQMAERQSRDMVSNRDAPVVQLAPFQRAEERARGRRHNGEPVSQDVLAEALRDQMAEREAQRARDAFCLQKPLEGYPISSLPSGDVRPAVGKRHSDQAYKCQLQGQLIGPSEKSALPPKMPTPLVEGTQRRCLSESRRMPFAEETIDADAHERAMVEKIIAARKAEAERLLHDE